MKGEIRITEWMMPANRNCMVAYVYRGSVAIGDNLPFYEQEVVITENEIRGMTDITLEICKSLRIREALQQLEKILAKEDEV